MKAACEVCGSPLRAGPNRVEIDGAIMLVCNNCSRLGRVVGGPPTPSVVRPLHEVHFASAPRPAVGKEPEFDVDPDYNVKIRQAREKLGLSQDQLGRMLNEKLSVVRMIETKKLKPDVNLTRKFMHHLKINLLVPLSELEGRKPGI